MTDWTDPDWLRDAQTWIGTQLAHRGMQVTGPIEQPHNFPWATVLRVPTADGPVWFKANCPALAYEAAAVALIAERRPDCVPPPLALDLARGWLLLADAGSRLRELIAEERSLERWIEVLPLYAGLQIDLEPDAAELVVRGVPHWPLSEWPDRYGDLLDELVGAPYAELRQLRDLAPRVGQLAAELGAYGLPDSIQHDDLHDGQVFARDGRYTILDWGDACVAHPLFTMAVTLGGQLAWGLDDKQGSVDVAPFRAAYLRPFEARAGRDLDAACRLAESLGWVCRAVNAHASGGESGFDGNNHRRTLARLAMFADGL